LIGCRNGLQGFRFWLKSLPVRSIASERGRKVRLLDDLANRTGTVVVDVVMEGMMFVVREGYVESEVIKVVVSRCIRML